MTTGNYTFGCNPCFDPSCALSILPTDGFGGSLYDCPFKVPVYNHTYSTNQITWHYIDTVFYQPRAANLTVSAISLAFGILTLANIVVLTPPHKRGFLHNTLLIGNAFQIIRSAIGVQLWTSGYFASSYLAMTADWNTPNWSTSFRVLLTIWNLSVCVVFACVQIAFYTLSHGMLAWMRIRYPMHAYYTLISTLIFVGLFSYCWRVVQAINQIRFIAFAKQGDYLPEIASRKWYSTLEYGEKYLIGINLGLWSGAFMVSALVVIWKRKRALFAWEVEGEEKGGWFFGRRRKVQSVYERTLRVVAVVGVESFVVPLMLSTFQFLPNWLPFPQTNALIMPIILTLLPILCLFNGGTVRAEIDTDVGRDSDRSSDTMNNLRQGEEEGFRCDECGCRNRSQGGNLIVPVAVGTGQARLSTLVGGGSLFESWGVEGRGGVGSVGALKLGECEGRELVEVDGMGNGRGRRGGDGRTGVSVYERELEDIDGIEDSDGNERMGRALA